MIEVKLKVNKAKLGFELIGVNSKTKPLTQLQGQEKSHEESSMSVFTYLY